MKRTGGGRYTEPLLFQKPDSSKADDFGQVDYANDAHWKTEAPRLGAVLEGAGSEFTSGEQVQATVTHRVRLPGDSTVRSMPPDRRIVWTDAGVTRRLQIVSRQRISTAPEIIEFSCIELA